MAAHLDDRRFWARLARKIGWTANAHDVEDSLHSAYLRLETYRQKAKVHDEEAFLVRATRNLLVDHHRRLALIANRPFEEECAEMADPAPLQDEVFETRKRLLHVQAGLERLPPRTREIFEMHRLDRLKYREIAERLEISVSAVEKHIARASLFLMKWTRNR